MKNRLLLITALLCAMPSWATDYNVSTDSELRAAILNDEANITVTANIDLDNSTLEITANRTVTVNLAGHTLDRKLTKRGEGGGQVFTVRSGATLNLTGGTLTGGWGGDGGALLNNGGTVTLTNVTITGNTADDSGGGIFNEAGGTLTMTDCTVTGNHCNKHETVSGGGIYSAGTLNMQGANIVTDNTLADAVNNLYLTTGQLITVIGKLTGSNIGITMQSATGTFTSGYNTDNAGEDPATFFKADLPEVMLVSLDADNEAQLESTLPEDAVYYIERSWDDGDRCVKRQVKTLYYDSYTTLTGGDDIELQPGFYVVKGNIEHDDIVLSGSGEHHLILCDGVTVEADILNVPEGHTVYIYGQVFDTGKLNIPFGEDDIEEHEAPIGGRDGKSCGTIIIHGGEIYVEGRDGSAGIGGGSGAGGGTVIIYGGNIIAKAGDSGAGIGSGGNYNPEHGSGPNLTSDYPSITGGSVTIYGGYIEAYGGDHGAGIGGGDNAGGAHVAIYGGIVKAWGATNGAGIGTGERRDDALQYTGELTVTGGEVYAYGSDDHDDLGGGGGGAGIGGGRDADGSTVTISGGYVYAKGGDFGAGIGSGCEALFSGGKQGGTLTVTGGRVEAYGGEDAAGIGGGEDADGGTINISGGNVYAKGRYGGAGIGGGEGGDGAHITITGGTVHASAGSGDTGNRAIGPGYGCDAYGSLTVGDVLMARAERLASAGERHDMCWYRTDVHVEPCDHQNHTYTIDGTTAEGTHTEVCAYCSTPFKAEEHTFVDEKCTVCGVTETVNYLRTYLPKNNGTLDLLTYTCEDTKQVVPGSVVILPKCPVTVSNLEFKGWEANTTLAGEEYKSPYTTTGGDLYAPGDQYTVANDVSFVPRYQTLNITLADDVSNGETLMRYNGMTANKVTLSGRTLKKNGNWNTLCLPFALSAEQVASTLAGCELKELDVAGTYSDKKTGLDPETGTLSIYFKTAASIEAGKPYIIRWTSGDDLVEPSFTSVTVEKVLNDVQSEDGRVNFYGVFSPRKFKADDKRSLYMGTDNMLYYPNQATTINAFRCYFHLKHDIILNAIQLNFDEGTTGISEMERMRNGENEKCSMDNGQWYDLQGRRVAQPTQKGIYINNGKKTVIK